MTLPTIPDRSGECSMCSQPSPGLTCERCMRSEMARPAILLAYDHAALEEMADSALDAARYWAHQAAVLRAQAARRAE